MEFLLLKIFLLFFIIQLVNVLVLGFHYKYIRQDPPIDCTTGLSIIIPFKNETERIGPLLTSIDRLVFPKDLAVEFIFVDDSSTDGGQDFITKKLKTDHRLLLNQGLGKKRAIQTGVLAAKNERIITWDADICVRNNYLVDIRKLPEADMWILPVCMKGGNFPGRLFSVDFSWLQLVTFVYVKWKRPFLCNGANLMFKRSAFIEAERIRDDYGTPSGDDIFLLRRFAEMKKVIKADHSKDLTVITDAPTNLQSAINQRKRWASKMNGLMEVKGGVLFIYLLLTMVVFVAVLVYALLLFSWVLLLPVLLKVLNEFLLLRFYKGGKDFFRDIPLVVVHQFFFPVYLFVLLICPKKGEHRWTVNSEKQQS